MQHAGDVQNCALGRYVINQCHPNNVNRVRPNRLNCAHTVAVDIVGRKTTCRLIRSEATCGWLVQEAK